MELSSATVGHRGVPPPSSGGGCGWFRQGVPRAGGVVPPRVVGLDPSPATPPGVSNLAGICLRGAHGQEVLRLPCQLPRALLNSGMGSVPAKLSQAAGFTTIPAGVTEAHQVHHQVSGPGVATPSLGRGVPVRLQGGDVL